MWIKSVRIKLTCMLINETQIIILRAYSKIACAESDFKKLCYELTGVNLSEKQKQIMRLIKQKSRELNKENPDLNNVYDLIQQIESIKYQQNETEKI